MKAGVDLIVTSQDGPTQAAKDATKTVPIVFTLVGDPVASGLVRNLAEPDGNVTGVSSLQTELTAKRLEVLKTLVPGLRRVWLIHYGGDLTANKMLVRARDAAPRVKVDLVPRAVLNAQELAQALGEIRPGDALLAPEIATLDVPVAILNASLKSRIPAVFTTALWVGHGGLASYGPDYYAQGVQAAGLVAKILRGARPSDVPSRGRPHRAGREPQDRRASRRDGAAEDHAPRGDVPAMSGPTPGAAPRGRLVRKYAVVLLVLVGGVLMASSLVELYFAYQETKRAIFREERAKAAAAAAQIERFVKEVERQVRDHSRRVRRPRGGPARAREARLPGRAGSGPGRPARAGLPPPPPRRARNQRAQPPRRLRQGATPRVPACAGRRGEPGGLLAGAEIPRGETGRPTGARFTSGTASSPTSPSPSRWGSTLSRSPRPRSASRPSSRQSPRSRPARAATPTWSTRGAIFRSPRRTSGPPEPRPFCPSPGADVRTERPAQPGRPGGAEDAGTVAEGLQGGQILAAHAGHHPPRVARPRRAAARRRLRPARAPILRSAVIFVLGLLLSVLASLVLARRMVAPIRLLQAGAARIGAGDLGHRIAVRTGDELETLGEEFNRTAARLEESYADLEQKVEARTRDLSEALEQQTATSEILRVISQSPTDVQPVFDTIVRSAVLLCGAGYGTAVRFDGELMHLAAGYNYTPEVDRALRQAFPMRPSPRMMSGRAILSRDVVQVEDALDDPDYAEGVARAGGFRSMLSAPMLRDGRPIGAIVVNRGQPGPFSGPR